MGVVQVGFAKVALLVLATPLIAACAGAASNSDTPRAREIQPSPNVAAPSAAASVVPAATPPIASASAAPLPDVLAEPPPVTSSEPVPDDAAAAELGPETVDGKLLKRLSWGALEPLRFRKAALPAKLAAARSQYRGAAYALRNGRWHQEVRTSCTGNAEGKVLITDDQGRVRALAVNGGSEDSYAEFRYLFDENGRLRLLFVSYRHIAGTATEQLVVLDGAGEVVACDHLLLKVGEAPDWDLCSSDEAFEPKLDPAVQRALRDGATPKQPRNELRDRMLDIHPQTEFNECSSRVVPK